MFDIALYIVMVLLALAMVGFIYRLIKGPSIPDRVIALDGMGIVLISMVAVFSIILKTSAYLDVILLLGILSFIGTASFSKFLAKGVIFERDHDN
ncbi:Na(+)/H(+) antiporter subunit F1 [Caldibacillus thermolactis]|jgi:multicomponent Na+:H+ antiporter subunit F|uniref:Na(+)/H(+) antiporter subunit F1 n=1 Tax=Pallidibacillus thermolactis TaxID=251051 RepID=A0ABT2WIR5_9BACI|nr:Na(+)/H(+) antiporter subunit F1 [Pallidibacillus thermolactis]MCU9595582.1 Na(+)/H(+) antiporter subunit F1 [Pallidibacillus thermolactis]MCU9600946.1 Na(+)/H(+) antiporter subunit F1 [Pallidibacillus thermolactis subsp. kokeshiiformis]MED1674390.1 Na(+)/H(+) antiporter subunit F1 [Pallidibacillus thermolactis subsp. kokeshiiformis]